MENESNAPVPQKRSRIRGIAAILMGAVLLVAVFLAGWYGHYFSLDKEVRTYLWAKSIVEKNYYRPVDEAELYEQLYKTLSVDNYSKLFTPAEYDRYEAEGKGLYSGIGISFYTGRGREFPLEIFSAAEGSPASLAGIRRGMLLFSCTAGEDSIDSGSYEDFADFLSAHANEEISYLCGYMRDGSDAEWYGVTPASYQAAFVYYRDSEASFRFRYEGQTALLEEGDEALEGLDGTTAYIRLDEFSGHAAAEFRECLSKMKSRGRKHLILDLRSNGGGYLDILGEIASLLLRDGKDNSVVAVAKYRDREEAFLCERSCFYDYFQADSRIYVLADESTASASECLIGALVDYRTTPYSDIFLRENENGVAKTFGKGIMQSHFDSASGAVMKLTVATVHWPLSGKCIHGVGVTAEDGAIPIPSEFLFVETDSMLNEVIARVCA